MKMFKLFTTVFLLGTLFSQGQEISDHAVGLRLGDSDGFGAEISYQHLVSRTNRLEANLGFRDHRNYNATKLSGLYQWVLPIDQGFHWYYGAGAGVGTVSYGNIPNTEDYANVFVFAAGNIGIEYNLDFPLLLSLDLRPEIGIAGYNGFSDNFDFDIALGVRYQF